MVDAAAQPVITLLTDYGLADGFVGVLHGVIARICPAARVIDLSHGIAPQDVGAGAAVLAQALQYMPVGVHVAIVDPTVGSERRAVALRTADGRTLVGPDNGLLWPAVEASGGVERAVEISRSRWRLEPFAATFHGRDLFAPVAAHLAGGEGIERAGEPLDPERLVRLSVRHPQHEDGSLLATVVHTDHFGNVQLGAGGGELSVLGVRPGDLLCVEPEAGTPQTATCARAFSDVPPGTLLVFEDSARRLALAVNRGNAAASLRVRSGERVRLRPKGRP